MGYPTSVSFKHQKYSSPWWALLTIIPIKVIALLPHLIVLLFLSIASALLGFIGVFAVLFTGKYPKSFEKFIIGVMRWNWRINVYFYCMTDKYPSFTLNKCGEAADLDFKHQSKSSRKWALLTIIPVKFLVLIPHFAIMYGYSLMAAACQIMGMFAVLFRHTYPQSFEKIIVGYMQYTFRIFAYMSCMTDKYPPFELTD